MGNSRLYRIDKRGRLPELPGAFHSETARLAAPEAATASGATSPMKRLRDRTTLQCHVRVEYAGRPYGIHASGVAARPRATMSPLHMTSQYQSPHAPFGKML